MHSYPFGRPVTPRPPSADGPRRAFILGAYPSALHVRWVPPKPHRPIQALAVDDEPEPFWTGEDEGERIEAWKRSVGFDDATMGRVGPCSRLNGPSGVWVRERVLMPLGLERTDCWITDCLDTYRLSDGQAGRVADTYAPFAEAAGLPAAHARPHPSEQEIVDEALQSHLPRLAAELRRASPEYVITLGNAALRVIRALAAHYVDADPGRAVGRAGLYGRPVPLKADGFSATWLPLAHPAAPAPYQRWHEEWIRRMAVRA